MEEILKDERFAHISVDPRYKKVPKAQRKIKIDKRFQSIFNDNRFQVTYTVDKRGRPVNQSSSENFRKYYDLSSSDENDSEENDSQEELNDINDDLKSNEIDHVHKKTLKSKDISDKKKRNDDSSKKPLIKETTTIDQDVAIKKVTKTKNQTKEFDKSSSDEESDHQEIKLDDLSSQLDSVKKRSKLPDTIKKKLHNLNVDYARGMGTLMSDSSSDEESSEESVHENEPELEHNWGELDKDADYTDTGTNRLAICNMDWDRIRAVDLMVLCSSFLPSGGHIKSITIYPSEFGLKRMKEEELKGPIELVEEKIEDNYDEDEVTEESKEGSKYHMERLRRYQLNRLKYYYAVVVCDSVDTASKLYTECDGLEYESSSTRLDLRYVPDDVTFDEEPKEVCTELPNMNKYQPRFFVNTALQQGKVSCTWDETDPARTQLAEKMHQLKGDADNLDDEDLQMFLASSSEDENHKDDVKAGNDTDNDSSQKNESSSSDDSDEDKDHDNRHSSSKSIQKYRNLLNKLQEDEEKKKNRDVELEITWGVGLKEKTQSLVDKKLKENSELTPFEQIIEKKKEKRKKKKEEKIKKKKEAAKDSDDIGNDNENDNALFSDDDLPDGVDLNDDYFKEEFADNPTKKSKKKNKKKGFNDEDLNPEEKQKKDELELLLLDDEDQVDSTNKSHFSLKQIQDMEENQSKKKRKGRKQIKKKKQEEPILEDDFQVDLQDERFNAVYTSHHFNIDPADSHYRKTKGMDAFIKEKISRKYKIPSDKELNGSDASPNKLPKLNSELSDIVLSIKKKTKDLK
ncbi:ESF1 homolog [Lycorma delicatula]|uniref:ESF1 homolog n=1 Tax=Lycorma delicatula TaxID=130591 RepID=UPI003F50E794